MRERNIPAFIMLCAGTVAIVTCIINRDSLLTTLKIVLLVLLVFYVIGIIVGKIVLKINKAANEAYELKEQERMKKENEALNTSAPEPTVSEETVASTKENEETIN